MPFNPAHAAQINQLLINQTHWTFIADALQFLRMVCVQRVLWHLHRGLSSKKMGLTTPWRTWWINSESSQDLIHHKLLKIIGKLKDAELLTVSLKVLSCYKAIRKWTVNSKHIVVYTLYTHTRKQGKTFYNRLCLTAFAPITLPLWHSLLHIATVSL